MASDTARDRFTAATFPGVSTLLSSTDWLALAEDLETEAADLAAKGLVQMPAYNRTAAATCREHSRRIRATTPKAGITVAAEQ